MLSDEEVAALSPGAAAASRLLRGGLSLTQIYRQHCRVVDSLEQQKAENQRLDVYFKELVKVPPSLLPACHCLFSFAEKKKRRHAL